MRVIRLAIDGVVSILIGVALARVLRGLLSDSLAADVISNTLEYILGVLALAIISFVELQAIRAVTANSDKAQVFLASLSGLLAGIVVFLLRKHTILTTALPVSILGLFWYAYVVVNLCARTYQSARHAYTPEEWQRVLSLLDADPDVATSLGDYELRTANLRLAVSAGISFALREMLLLLVIAAFLYAVWLVTLRYAFGVGWLVTLFTAFLPVGVGNVLFMQADQAGSKDNKSVPFNEKLAFNHPEIE